LLIKFHRRKNLTALLVTIWGSKNKNKHSEFWYLTSQRYLLYKFRLKKDKPWVYLSKFRCRTILMHLLLLKCGKFACAQLMHQIFFKKKGRMWDFGWVRSFYWMLGPQVWSIYFHSDHCWGCECLLPLTGIVIFRRFFSRKVSIGSVAYFRTWNFYVERKTSMTYPGFEPGPPRSEVRRANHCAIGAPLRTLINQKLKS
jgi:hypothetical protein